MTSQQKQLSKQLYQQYLHGRQSYVQMVLQNDHPSAMARDVHYFSYIAKVRAELINKMQGNLNHLNQLNEETTSTLEKSLNSSKNESMSGKCCSRKNKLNLKLFAACRSKLPCSAVKLKNSAVMKSASRNWWNA